MQPDICNAEYIQASFILFKTTLRNTNSHPTEVKHWSFLLGNIAALTSAQSGAVGRIFKANLWSQFVILIKYLEESHAVISMCVNKAKAVIQSLRPSVQRANVCEFSQTWGVYLSSAY